MAFFEQVAVIGAGTMGNGIAQTLATHGSQVALIDIDAKGVMKMIPHRYPFLMIDRVENAVVDKGCVGIKNVSMNEAIFQGHFPTDPVFPGVLIIEAMAQTAAVLVVHTLGAAFHGKDLVVRTTDGVPYRMTVRCPQELWPTAVAYFDHAKANLSIVR